MFVVEILDPRHLEKLVDGGSCLLVPIKALKDEFFGVVANVAPVFVLSVFKS